VVPQTTHLTDIVDSLSPITRINYTSVTNSANGARLAIVNVTADGVLQAGYSANESSVSQPKGM